MSVELIMNPDQDGEGDGFELVPNYAWRAFAGYVEEHSADFPKLAELSSQKPTPDALTLATELDSLLADESMREHVTAVAARLQELIAGLDESDVLLVD